MLIFRSRNSSVLPTMWHVWCQKLKSWTPHDNIHVSFKESRVHFDSSSLQMSVTQWSLPIWECIGSFLLPVLIMMCCNVWIHIFLSELGTTVVHGMDLGWHRPAWMFVFSSSLKRFKRQQGYIRSEAIRQPVRFKHLRGMERPVAPHLTWLSSDRGHNRVQNLALK